MQDLLRFFEYEHLPLFLQDVSRPFCELAHLLVEQRMNLPVKDSFEASRDAETEMTLRKLLEAKDCAVRAAL